MRLLSKKIIITELNLPDIMPADIIVTYENDKADRVELFYNEDEYVVGNVYVAHVNDLVKNINAAFATYVPDKKAYLSLDEAEHVFFVNRKNTTKVCEGDNIVVQIKKEPIKTKDAVCSTSIEIPGKYIVLTYGKPSISVSAKVRDNEIRKVLTNVGEAFVSQLSYNKDEYAMLTEEMFNSIIQNTGIIFRTEAVGLEEFSTIIAELEKLFTELFLTLNKAMHTPARTCIRQAENPVISMIKELSKSGNALIDDMPDSPDKATEIITDSSKYLELLKSHGITARFYEDKLLPLYKLYSIESVLEQIQSRKIWLKSGGYLIIDYTEAMTVIDVNTGKCEKGKNKEATILNINLEAATEAMRQLRLRNISGIIIIDFIDMKSDEHKQMLLKHLRNEASKDLIKTSVIGMTRLNLVEITRKKIRERVKIRSNM